MAGCCVLPLRCGSSGVSTLRICAGGVAGDCGTAMVNMVASFLIATVYFSPSCGMGLDGTGF